MKHLGKLLTALVLLIALFVPQMGEGLQLTKGWNENTVSAGAEINNSTGAFQHLDQRVVNIPRFGGSDVTLSTYFNTTTSGSGTITQSDVDGAVELNSPSANDAEQLVDLIPIDISSPFRFSFGVLDVSGVAGNFFFTVRQKTGLPAIGGNAVMEADGLIRILTRQSGTAGLLTATYWNGAATKLDWESGTAWTTVRTKTFSALPTPFKVIFTGDATSWQLIIEDKAGNVLETMDKVAWAATRNPGGDDRWLTLGDAANDFFSGVNNVYSYMRWPTETAINFLTAAQIVNTGAISFEENFNSDDIQVLVGNTPVAPTEFKVYIQEDAGAFSSAINVNTTILAGETGWHDFMPGTAFTNHTSVTLKLELNTPNTDLQLQAFALKIKGVTIAGGGGADDKLIGGTLGGF